MSGSTEDKTSNGFVLDFSLDLIMVVQFDRTVQMPGFTGSIFNNAWSLVYRSIGEKNLYFPIATFFRTVFLKIAKKSYSLEIFL